MRSELTRFESVVAEASSLNMQQLIQNRRAMIDFRRIQFDDHYMYRQLGLLIGRLNKAIRELNLQSVESCLCQARNYITEAYEMVSHPPVNINPDRLATRVSSLANTAQAIVSQLETDRFLAPLAAERAAQVEHLKSDIEAMRQTTLVAAAIRERQLAIRMRQKEQARRQEALRRQEVPLKSDEVTKWISRFKSALDASAVKEARHALFLIEQSEPEVLRIALAPDDPSMALVRMRQQLTVLRENAFGRHGIRNLDAPIPSAAIS